MMFISSRKGALEFDEVVKFLMIAITVAILIMLIIALEDKGILIVDKIKNADSIRDVFS